MKFIITLILTLCLLLSGVSLADERGDMLVAAAVSELGYTATKGGYTKFGEWGGNAYGEWCSEFVSWSVNFADAYYGVSMLGNDYPLQTSCASGAAWFKERGRYVTVNDGLRGEEGQVYLSDGVPVSDRPYVPRPGDLVYIEWFAYNRLDHTGIVEFVTQDAEGNYWIHTIEGNNSERGQRPTAVARYTYALNDPSIRGYGILEEGVAGWEMGMGSSGDQVVGFQKNLKTLGYYEGEPAGKFGKGTVEATKKFQSAMGIAASGTADWQTLAAMSGEIAKRREQTAIEAEAKAQAEVAETIEQATEAIQSGWFGEFDPQDEAAVWARLTGEITVINAAQNEKVYLYDEPNGSRKTSRSHRGYFYGESVAVKVLDERDGWTQIQAYNDFDELESGWIKTSRLKTTVPNATYGLVVDKMTQRLYIYKEGKLLTTLLCSTGTTGGQNEAYAETASGEFLLVSWTGGFWSDALYCDQAIRFNGGDLLHMVPAIYSGGRGEDNLPKGTPDFSRFESALGRRASHGCVRVQREKNADGYNHTWIWNNLRGQKNVKLIVWDDDGRRLPETPAETPMYYNPNGGTKYHTDARCQSVRSAYLPLTGITYGELTQYPYNQLAPCGTCSAPQRPESVSAWNEAIDEAYAQLGIEP